jgi:hypothetical protein
MSMYCNMLPASTIRSPVKWHGEWSELIVERDGHDLDVPPDFTRSLPLAVAFVPRAIPFVTAMHSLRWHLQRFRPRQVVDARLASPLFGEASGQRSLPQHLPAIACNEARCRS